MASILAILVALALIFLASFWSRLRLILKFQPYSAKLPGPKPHWFFGNTAFFHGISTAEVLDSFIKTANELREQGANVMRLDLLGKLYIWPLDGATAAKLIESTTELDKGDDYRFTEAWLGQSVLLAGYGDKWRSHRKLLTPSFHFAKLEGYVEVFNSESRIMIECLERFADSGDTVDLFPFIKRCTLDIICETAMGTKVDAQSNHDHPYVKAVEGFNKLSVTHSTHPYLQIDFIFWLLGYKSQKEQFLTTLKKFTGDVLAERRAALASGEVEKETSRRNMNFLDILLSSKESDVLTEQEIREEVDTFMFAGHDTTTGSFSWMCWNLAHNPDVQEKVYREIVEIFGEDPSVDVTTEGIKKLDYTERVLKESKRRIAPVPMVQRKLRQDMVLDGHVIPSGANVAIAPTIYHSNPKVFPNPDTFDPDRFLPEVASQRNAYDYVPFSAGLRNCIGQKFSQLNEKVMLIHMLKNFKLTPTLRFDETRPCFEIIAKPSNGIPVKLTRR